MEEVRQLVQEEGREARNLIAFHVAVDTPVSPAGRVPRKPPRGLPPPRRAPHPPARLRSASTGRDKRSELRARYWALLFGDLQRAIGEIYNTVEVHENPNECQEVILVLENYTRDFKALCEWFRLKWEYESTPPPQRPQSLAWEIRKTDFVRPESRRTHSVKSSPSVSGKNSPCLSGHNTPSGKNSPNLTGKASPGSGKISPRMTATSPKGSVEFFGGKPTAKTTKSETKGKETRLSDIKEKDVKDVEEAKNTKLKDFAKEVKTGNKASDKEAKTVDMALAKEVNIYDQAAAKEDNDPSKPTEEIEKAKEEVNIYDQAVAKEEEPPKLTVEFGIAKECPNVAPEPVKKRTQTKEQVLEAVRMIMMQGEVDPDAEIYMEAELLAKQLTENVCRCQNTLNQNYERSLLGIDEGLIHHNPLPIVIQPTHQWNENQDVINHLGAVGPVVLEFDEIGNEAPGLLLPFIDLNNYESQDLTNGLSIAIESVDQESISAESPSKSDDNFADVSNESSKSEDKIPEINDEIKQKDLKSKSTDKMNKKNTKVKNTDQANNQSLTYDDSMAKITNGCAIDDDKLKVSNNYVTQDNKPKDVPKNDAKEKAQTKIEIKMNEKESKTPLTKKEEAKEIKKPEENKDSKRDEKILDRKPQTEQKDVDMRKDEPRRLETRPIFELKPTYRPAYSQAAAKPKLISIKTEIKPPVKSLPRSKTVVEIRTFPPTKTRAFTNRNQKNKCSYPFNLTTGRTSLFDGGNKVTNTKKAVNDKTTNKTQMAAGDNRNQIKTEPKNRPPRPVSLKINEKGDKQEKINSSFEKIKDISEYSSSETVVTQIDMSRMESSESLKTIVPDNDHDITNSIEVLNVDGSKNDNEGWLTVKSRRLNRESKKSKSHWSNRFHQPSATTSLPTLNMIESPKSETNPIITSQLDRAKSEQPQTPDPKPKKVAPKENAKDMSMIRQKSDVTGLKTRSSRTKALKKDKKVKDSEDKLTKNRLHSSLESLTIGLARSQESTADAFDFDKWRAEFKSTFKYLEYDDQIQDDTEILKTADPSEMSEIAEMTSQIEENERKISLALDFQTEVDQRKLCEEEDLLNRQIMELQQVSDIDMDTETDETETDAEILCEDSALDSSCQSTDTLSSLSARLEDQYETALAGMSWAERVDTLGALEALVARDPGRAQQLHAKLSQGMKRRGSLQDALRRLQAKQARAEKQRTHFHTERTNKIHQLLARVEEVKVAKNQLIDEKRIRMERRLQKAAENRDQHIKDIVRKAHDEEEKLREIAFIKQLEAENRRHEFLEQCRSHTTRLREMRRERLDKLEQKAAREAAVGARKKALEAARKQHVESLLERRKERDARVEELKEQKKQERDDAAREKAEGVKSRLSALAAAAELEADALRSRIRDKQDASQQRLESHLQAIREKATTGQRQATTSESQEPDKKEEEAAKALEEERKERERMKNLRKRARKMKQKLLAVTKDSKALDTSAIHNLVHPRSAKMHKLISLIFNLIKPFMPEADIDEKHNGVEEACNLTNNNEEENEPEKPKKKKKKNRDRQLSACDSVSSSISENRTGTKIATPVLDTNALEKLLNELLRMCTQPDNINSILKEDKTIFTKIHAIKTLGLLLCFAVERDDLAVQLNARALNTCMTILHKIISVCPMAAAIWVSYPGIVYSIVLLQRQMEKNMLNDPREDILTGILVEAVSLGLNNILYEPQLIATNHLIQKRTRGFNLISFLCLSGVVSYPERCTNECRRYIQTLLNVCGDVLLAKPFDGPERLTAQQNLSAVLGPDMFQMRNDFCMLFAEGAEITQNDVFVNAARIAHVIRALAEIDHKIVQRGFGEGGWPLEFRAAVARLLSQHAPSDKDAPRNENICSQVIRLDAKVSLTFVLDLIELIGYVCVNNPPLRDTICDNWSVIKMLCNLPANWMVSPPNMHKLLPTLLVLAERPATAEVIATEVSMQILEDYMNSEIAQKVKTIQLLKIERAGHTATKTK